MSTAMSKVIFTSKSFQQIRIKIKYFSDYR